MKTYMECIPCFIKQALGSVRSVTDDERIIETAMKEVCNLCSEIDVCKTPPQMGQEIHRIIRRVSGNPDPYKEIKRKSNQAAFNLLPEAEAVVRESQDPFEAAVRFAIAGNIMFFFI